MDKTRQKIHALETEWRKDWMRENTSITEKLDKAKVELERCSNEMKDAAEVYRSIV